MDPILTVTSTAAASILSYAGQLFTDTWLLIALAVGLPVGFYIINKVIGIVAARAKSK
jgi:hypothetical protein